MSNLKKRNPDYLALSWDDPIFYGQLIEGDRNFQILSGGLEAVAFIEHATSNPDKGTCTRVIPDILPSPEKGSLGS